LKKQRYVYSSLIKNPENTTYATAYWAQAEQKTFRNQHLNNLLGSATYTTCSPRLHNRGIRLFRYRHNNKQQPPLQSQQQPVNPPVQPQPVLPRPSCANRKTQPSQEEKNLTLSEFLIRYKLCRKKKLILEELQALQTIKDLAQKFTRKLPLFKMQKN